MSPCGVESPDLAMAISAPPLPVKMPTLLEVVPRNATVLPLIAGVLTSLNIPPDGARSPVLAMVVIAPPLVVKIPVALP